MSRDKSTRSVILLLVAVTLLISNFGFAQAPPPPPHISSLSPTSGPVGTTVTITGTHLTWPGGTTSVLFNDTTSAPIISLSATSIVITVPMGAYSGTLDVGIVYSDGSSNSSNAASFTVTGAGSGPSITTIVPVAAPVGGALRITGSGFGSTQGSSRLSVNNVVVSDIWVWSDGEIDADVPIGATTGNVVVQVGSSNSNGVNLTIVPAPSITSLSASSGPIGATITISGTNLLPDSGPNVSGQLVYFYPTGGCPGCGIAALPVSTSNTSYVVQVPAGALSGKISVSYDWLASNPLNFTVTGTLPPVAVAVADSAVPLNTSVRLDGTHSYDLNGLALTYQWSFTWIPTGSTATLSNATTPFPTFAPDVAGLYVVKLVVNNGTQTSAPAYGYIDSPNDPFPEDQIANAGPDQTVQVGATVFLDASSSANTMGTPLNNYMWCLWYAPDDNSRQAYLGLAPFSDPTAINPSFVATSAGSYYALLWQDGFYGCNLGPGRASDWVKISTVNSQPIANAGPNQSIQTPQTIQLDGTGSTDVDGNLLTYSWALLTKPSGSTATLSNPTSPQPTFNADIVGTYVAQLIVNDGTVKSLPGLSQDPVNLTSTVTITNLDVTPVANPGPAQTVSVGSFVGLDGAASSDVDGHALTYKWALISRPTTSQAALSYPTSETPYFSADVAGKYVVQLIVNDGVADSTPATVVISTDSSRPVANPGPHQTVATGSTVQLSGADSSDADGRPLSYRWAILYQPSGANAALSNPKTEDPTFVASIAGLYVVQLIVNDGLDSFPVTTWVKAQANQAPVVSAGPNQTITLPINRVTLYGTATDDGLPNGTLTVSWTSLSGPGPVTFSSPNTAVSDATFSTPGQYVLQISANDSQLQSSATTTVTVNPAPVTIVLSPIMAGPDITGSKQIMTATVTQAGVVVPNLLIQFTVRGPNATSTNATTNSSGIATFTYTGGSSGTDTVQAASSGQNSNSVSVSWITPIQNVSTTAVVGRFFLGTSLTLTPSSVPVFTQTFPNIDFDPASGTIPGNTSGVDNNTRPFTDITTDLNGNFTGTIVAQGNGYQAGVGPMYQFQAEFTGTLIAAKAGNISVTFFTDDGMLFGVGGGATYVSGSLATAPPSGTTVFQGFPLMLAYNIPPFATTAVFNVPAPGAYPYEIDYFECCGGPLALDMTIGQTTTSGLPPIAQLTLTPTTPASLQVGQTETLTVQAIDGSGAPVPNLGVGLQTMGANTRQLTATTNSAGQAVFQYAGANGGTDIVEAIADITGTIAYSNIVKVPWTIPTQTGCSVFIFTPQGWIGSPAIGATVQGPIPITLASGITLTSGTLKMFPSGNPNQVTVLNPNTTGTGPITLGTIDGTLLANGEYTIQLEATQSTGACQLNEIVVSVTGAKKPGRETVTVTDLRVPLAGIPINIGRVYDSLNRGTSEDFGNGWSLDSNVQLSVDQLFNVTFTWNGQRQTFYFTPKSAGQALFPWLVMPAYTPQPGTFGTLTSNGCNLLIQTGGALVQDTLGVACFPAGSYSPTVYTYTDPAGRVYTIRSSGQLQSIQDLNGNVVTFTPNGITSTVGGGVTVPFVRDTQNRITKITDLNGNNYVYSYDTPCGTGNLCSVTFPGTPTIQATYTYLADHSLNTQSDPNSNMTTHNYFPDGRLQTVTGPLVPAPGGTQTQFITQYCYTEEPTCSITTANTTKVTNPDTGIVTTVVDSFGKPLSVTDALQNTTTYTYYPNELVQTVTDPLQNPPTQYTYDANGFITSVIDPLNHKTTWLNNPYGGVTQTTDAANQNTTNIGYDSYFNPTTVTDSLGQVWTRTYDSMGNVLTQTDANGNTTQFTYDSRGNLLKQVDAMNEITRFTYDNMNRMLTKTDPRGNPTTYTYDALGNLTDTTDAVGHVTRYTYDLNGNKTSDVDALDRITSYSYDALNRLTKVTYPDNTTKQYTYDFRNNKLTEIDQSGRATQYQYYLDGRLKSVTRALGTSDAGTVQYTYDKDGNLQTVTDEVTNKTTYFYDAANRRTKVLDAKNVITLYGYDADNRLTSITDGNQHTTQYTPDPRGRLKTVIYNDTTTDQYVYDGVGNRKQKNDQANNVTKWSYDAVNRLSSVTDGLQNVTKYGYDLASNLISITDANNHVTSFQYDSSNRKALRQLPVGMFETFAYDAVGNIGAKTDFNGKTTTYTYDVLKRLHQKIPDPSLSQPTISFTYFPTGTRQTMVDATGTTNYTYDNRDRLKIKATPEGTLNYTYDAHSNLLTITSSNTNGASVTYTPDQLNRLSTVTDNRMAAQGVSSPVTTYGYDPAGNLSGYTYSANGLQSTYTYDTLNRLSQVTWKKGTNSLASFAYAPYPAGNVHTLTELSGRNVSYVYDADYHLKSETIASDPGGNNGAESYNYDPVGNRQQLTSTIPSLPGSVTYNYDANDRLTTDTYDNDGNTIASSGSSYTYDFENRMLMKGAIVMVYDGDGNRVSETVGSTTTKFLVDDKNPTGLPQVLDETVNGSVTRTYAYGLGRISENQLISGTWTPSFYGYDGHGNARFLGNSVGTITDSYTFDAFGAQIASTGTTSNPYLYSGERFDSALNLYHLRARYYNMLTGRFGTMEHRSCCKTRACSLRWSNSYAYADDDPVNRIDPTGRDAIAEYVVDLRPLVIAATGVYLLAKAIETFDEECELFAYEFDGSRTKCHYHCPHYGELCSHVDGTCPDPELSIFLSPCD